MKKILYFLTAAAVAVAMAACQKPADGPNKPDDQQPAAAAPTADFDFAVNGMEVTFTNKSQNATAYKWAFGDDETSKEASPKHTYAAAGKYTVKLTASNADGVTASKEAEVTVVGAAKAYFTYKAQVDVIAYNELLKGGSMEEDDAQYWTFIHTGVFPEGNYETPDDSKPSWVPTFGFTEDGPAGGKGGCLRLSSENQVHDQANNVKFYQAIEVEEGDRLEISAQMKWGENTNDCGLLWFGIAESESEVGADGTSVVEMFNYWSAAGTAPVPALDGGFDASADYIAANAALELGYSNAGEPVAVYWAQKSGTVYFYVDYRSVWGPFFGPGIFLYFDELSVKVTFEE